MRDDPSLRRQWILLKSLSLRHHGLTVREMAADVGVTAKTIRRDLDLFRSLGFPLDETIGEFGRKTWRIQQSKNQPPLSFSFDEAVSLYLGRRLLEPLAGTVFWEAAQRAFQKIRASLGRAALDYLDRFSGLFQPTAFGTHDYAKRSEVIETVQLVVEDGKWVRIRYQSERAAEPTDRDVYPYGIAYHGGALHLIAYDPEGDKVKHYKVDRIEAAEVGPTPSRQPPALDLAAHLASAFGIFQSVGESTTVKVRFAPSVARYVLESTWPGCRGLTRLGDGGVLGEFQLSGTEDFKRWIMGFGARAVVLEPERLRREIVEEMQALLTIYTTPERNPDRSAPALPETGGEGDGPGRHPPRRGS